jgi:hypothetical protein
MSPEYIAGLFDGEGCILVTRGSLRVQIAGCYRPTIEALPEQFGGWICRDKDKGPSYKTCYRWVITCSPAQAFLRTILPYLREKREQAELALQITYLPQYFKGAVSKRLTQSERLVREHVDRELRRAKRQGAYV